MKESWDQQNKWKNNGKYLCFLQQGQNNLNRTNNESLIVKESQSLILKTGHFHQKKKDDIMGSTATSKI